MMMRVAGWTWMLRYRPLCGRSRTSRRPPRCVGRQSGPPPDVDEQDEAVTEQPAQMPAVQDGGRASDAAEHGAVTAKRGALAVRLGGGRRHERGRHHPGRWASQAKPRGLLDPARAQRSAGTVSLPVAHRRHRWTVRIPGIQDWRLSARCGSGAAGSVTPMTILPASDLGIDRSP